MHGPGVGDTIIARYRVSADADIADPGTETRLLQVSQPYANHNGGGLAFGPDGYLYIGLGDGGSAGGGGRRRHLTNERAPIDAFGSCVARDDANPDGDVRDAGLLPE